MRTDLPDRLPDRHDEPEKKRLQTQRPAHTKGDDSYALAGVTSVSTRVGRRALRDLRHSLSGRDIAIVGAVAEHRYLTARQIEQLLFFTHRSQTTATRICRRVLQRLTDDRVLARLERRIGGAAAGSAAYIYALGPAGHRILDGDGRRRRGHEPSLVFLRHTLAVADTRIELELAHRASSLRLITVEVEPACWRSYHGYGGGRERVRPDLHVATSTEEFDDFWFLEIDLSTESIPAVIRKCRSYEHYRRSGREQERSGVFPAVVWVTQDERRRRKIQQAIDAARTVPAEIFRVTTSAHLIPLIVGGPA